MGELGIIKKGGGATSKILKLGTDYVFHGYDPQFTGGYYPYYYTQQIELLNGLTVADIYSLLIVYQQASSTKARRYLSGNGNVQAPYGSNVDQTGWSNLAISLDGTSKNILLDTGSNNGIASLIYAEIIRN